MAMSRLPVTWLMSRRCFVLEVVALVFKKGIVRSKLNKPNSLYFGL